MIFVCHVTLQDHVIKVINDFMVRSLSKYVTEIGSHRHSGSRDMIFVCHMTLQGHLIRALHNFTIRSPSR